VQNFKLDIMQVKKAILSFFKTSIFFLFACNEQANNEAHWEADDLRRKTVGNLSFTFPSKGYAYENRDKLVAECLVAIKTNFDLIKLHNYKDTISVQFLNSRQEMKEHTGMTPSGIALVEPKILYIVANANPKEVKPPIRHELMHMISMTTWGYPDPDSNWMNEGLAAFAENNCNGYNDEQIYRYLLDKNMLVSMDALTTGFYKQPEMIAYHQAAYIVQYLLSVYGTEKFKALWTQGFADFEKIYGISFSQITVHINEKAKQDYPSVPSINWSSFQVGCL
jgi:hypothetical protein